MVARDLTHVEFEFVVRGVDGLEFGGWGRFTLGVGLGGVGLLLGGYREDVDVLYVRVVLLGVLG